MAAYTKKVFFICFVAICLWCIVKCDSSRKVSTHLNYDCNVPECKEGVNGSFANLVYVKAEGDHDTLHYVIASIGVPTVLVIRTKLNPNNVLKVDWEKLVSENSTEFSNESVTMTMPSETLYQYALAFTKLHEYNDTKNVADLNQYPRWNSTARVVRPFTDFKWMEVSGIKGEPNSFVFNSTEWGMDMDDDNLGKTKRNYTPSLSFIFRLFGNQSREMLLPHLLYNENITQFDFTLDNFTPSFTMSRFALELAMFSSGGTSEAMSLKQSESIDDEYTPGVFKVTNLRTKPSHQSEGGFLQWKPVCYQNTRQHSVATKVGDYMLGDIKNVTSILETSVVFAHFGEELFSKSIQSIATNLSFGLTDDGTYTSTNYTSWSASLGFGVPPSDKISILVIGVIAAGLGIPVIIIVFGGLFTFIRNRRKNNYRQLQDVSSSYPALNS